MARQLKLDTSIEGVAPVVAGFEGMAKGIDKAGDQAAQTERQLSRLSRQITETQAKMALLTKQFNETGDSKFIKEFGHEKRALAGLRSMQQELDKTEASAKKAGVALDALTPGGDKRPGISGQLRLPGLDIAKAIGPGGLTAIAAPLLAETGGLIAAGGLLTAGIGATIGGVALAARRKEVKDAFSSLTQEVGRELDRDAEVFAAPLIRSAHLFGDAFRKEEAGIRGALRDASGYVEPLAAGVAGLAHGFLPGFEHAVAAAGPVVKELSESVLPAIGQGVGNLFDATARSVPGAVDALRDLGQATKVTLTGLGSLVEVLSAVNHGLHEVDTLGGRVPSTLERTGVAVDFLSQGIDGLLHGDFEGRGASPGNTSVMKGLERDLRDLGGATASTAAEFRGLHQAMADAFDETLNLDKANLDFKKGYLDLKESIADNGKTLNENTREGQANLETLRSWIDSAKNARDAAILQAGGVKASTTAVANADAGLKVHLDQIRQWALKLGLPLAVIDQILAKYYALLNAPAINKQVSIGGPARSGGSSRNKVQAFAEGGTVDAPAGQPVLAIVHGGEEVLTQQKAAALRAGRSYVNPYMPTRAASGGVAVAINFGGSASDFDRLMASWFMAKKRTGEIIIEARDVRQ